MMFVRRFDSTMRNLIQPPGSKLGGGRMKHEKTWKACICAKTWKACICAMNVVDGYECYEWLYGSYADLHELWTPSILESFS